MAIARCSTDANLRAAGIKPVGTGRNLFEARAPQIVERHGVYFAFLAYDDIAAYYQATGDGAGSAPLDASTIAEDVANARKFANVVIVVPHWGVEYQGRPVRTPAGAGARRGGSRRRHDRRQPSALGRSARRLDGSS